MQLNFLDTPQRHIIRRDKVLEAVHENSKEWSNLAFIQFSAMLPYFISEHPTFLAEDIHAALVKWVGNPPSANSWGPFIKRLLKTGLIEETGRWIATKGTKANARRAPQYRGCA